MEFPSVSSCEDETRRKEKKRNNLFIYLEDPEDERRYKVRSDSPNY